MKLSSIKRDVNLSENGVWVTGAYGDMDLLIAASNNKKYKDMIRKEIKPYERALRTNTLSDKVFTEIQDKCVAKHILLGWRNMQDDEGQEIPYSYDKALEILKDPENVDFRELVLALADEAEVFRKEAVEDTTFQA
jgi:hypothetical protein